MFLHACMQAAWHAHCNAVLAQSLQVCRLLGQPQHPKVEPTWKEHMRVSSTLIMAPALSNSPQ